MPVKIEWKWTNSQNLWQEESVEVITPISPASEAGESHSKVELNFDLRLSGEQFQTINGWGGCFNEQGWAVLLQIDQASREQILDELFDPLGSCRFRLCRVPIGANDYALDWYSLNETQGDFTMQHFTLERDKRYLIPYIEAALARQPDLYLFASPWSPPSWMKQPSVYNYGKLRWEKPVLDAYSLYLLKFVQSYQALNLPIRQLHVQNEPNSDQKFPSCVWTGEEMRDFIRDYLGPRFRQSKIKCEIWAGTIEREDYNSWANTILSDPMARSFIRGVGYQWAGKGAVQKTHASWPNLPLLQTENECGDGTNSWLYAHYVFDLIWHYLTNGVNAYIYWNMVLPLGGRSSWGWTQNSLITVDPLKGSTVLNPEFYLFKHFSHFVQPGAIRLGLVGAWTGNALAFRNPDDSVVVVVNNPFDRSCKLRFSQADYLLELELKANSFNTLVIPEKYRV